MKRPIFIILSVIIVFVLLGTSVMYLLGPKYGTTFSTVTDFGYGGGAPMEPPAAEPAMPGTDLFAAEE